MEKVGEYEKMEEKKNKKIITECLNNVKRNSLKKEKESKINISLKIVIPIVIAILLVTFIVSFILLNYNKQSDNYQLSGSQEYQTTTYSDEYKKTSDLTDADLNDAYQKNYQKSTADDGSYLIKSAEWTDKQKGEGFNYYTRSTISRIRRNKCFICCNNVLCTWINRGYISKKHTNINKVL